MSDDVIRCMRSISKQELYYINETLRVCVQELNGNDVVVTTDLLERIRESHRIITSILGAKHEDTGNT